MGKLHGLLHAVALVAVLTFGMAVQAEAFNRCLLGKQLCVRKKVTALLRCHEKAERSSLPADHAAVVRCIRRAKLKFEGSPNKPENGCFARLEAKQRSSGDGASCPTTDDRDELETVVDTFVVNILSRLRTGVPFPIPLPESLCDDGVDNDLDGLPDCRDEDCGDDAACPCGVSPVDCSLSAACHSGFVCDHFAGGPAECFCPLEAPFTYFCNLLPGGKCRLP